MTRQSLKLAAMLAPALAVVILLFGGGLLLAGMQSLGYLPIIGRNSVSLQAYRDLLSNPLFYRSLGLSLWIATAATALSTLLALLCALALRHKGHRFATFMLQLNLPIPHAVGAIGILFLFSQSGLFARLGYLMGILQDTADFPALIFDPYGIGIILEYVWKTTCFTGIILLAALQGLGDTYENVAQTLGANRWQRFRHVTLPLLTTAILSSSVLVFAFTFGAFEVPFLLGSRANSALPVLAYRRFTADDLNERPEAMAISIILSAIVTLFIWFYMQLVRKNNEQ